MNSTPDLAGPIAPPAMLGIVGGGQMGRYFAMAARAIGYRTTLLDPDPSAPAAVVADVHLVAPYDDPAALATLADTCALVTTELEHAPVDALRTIEHRVIVRPAPASIGICQDRIAERTLLADLGVPLAPWVPITTADELAAASDPSSPMAFPAILKPARLGAEGVGHVLLAAREQIEAAWDQLGRVPCVLEERLRVGRELSMVLARAHDGRTACYPVTQNLHVKGRLDTTQVPATLPSDGQHQAEQLCTFIAEELGFVGVMAVEMFVVGRAVYVNELAPRPHDTGHYTLDASATSQFEQQVRAVCGLGLGSTALAAPAAATVNLAGELWAAGEPNWSQVLAEPGAHLHLYGHADARPGRRMGHLTVIASGGMSAASLARRLRTGITPKAP